MKQMKQLFNYFKRTTKSEEGFTLAEVLVAMGLFAIIGTASAYFLVNSTQTISSNENKDNATQYVRDYIETVKAVEYNKLGFDPSNAAVPTRVERNGFFFDTVTQTGLTTDVNGLSPRKTETVEAFQYTVYTYIYWTDGTAPTVSTAYEQKTVEVEVWLDGKKLSSAQFVRTPTAAERPVAGGVVNSDAVAEGQKTPEEPTILVTLQGADDNIVRLEFTANYAKDYLLEYQVNGGTWGTYYDNSFANSTIDPKVYVTPQFPDGANITFRITGINSNGSGNPGSVNVIIPSAKPAAPTVFLNQYNDNTVRIYWGAVQYADSYLVQYTVNGGAAKTKTTLGTEVTTEALSPGDVLAVTVTGYNGATVGYPSNVSLTLVNKTPAAPVLAPLDQRMNNVAATWPSVANAVKYEVYYTVNGAGGTTVPTTDNAAILENFTNNNVISAKVRAANSANSWSAWSNIRSLTINLNVPSTPVISGVMDTTAKTYTMTWPATSDTAGYIVYSSKTNSSTLSTWDFANTNTRTETYTVQVGEPLYFKVKAVSPAGVESAMSNTLTALIPDQKPGKITTTAYASANGIPNYNFTDTQSGDKHTYTWDPVPYAVEYEVYYIDALGGSWKSTTISSAEYIAVENVNTYFRIMVRGVSITGLKGDWGTQFSFQRGPDTPTSFSTTGQQGQVYASWGAGTGATYYQVQYVVNNGTAGATWYWWDSTGTPTSVTFNANVNEGDRYDGHIRSVSAYGVSAWSPYSATYATMRGVGIPSVSANPHTSGGLYDWPDLACDTGSTAYYQSYETYWQPWKTNSYYLESFSYGYGGSSATRQKCVNNYTGIESIGTHRWDTVGYRLLANNSWNWNMWMRLQQATSFSAPPGTNYGRPNQYTTYAAYSFDSKVLQNWMNSHDNGVYGDIVADGYWGPATTLKLQQNVAIRCGYWVAGDKVIGPATLSAIQYCMNTNRF